MTISSMLCGLLNEGQSEQEQEQEQEEEEEEEGNRNNGREVSSIKDVCSTAGQITQQTSNFFAVFSEPKIK